MSIGQRLVVEGLIHRSMLGEALARVSSEPMALPEALLRSGIDPVTMVQIACQVAGVDLLPEHRLLPDSSEIARILPAEFARRCLVLPIRMEDGRLVVACADPTDRHVLDEAARIARRPIRAHGAEADQLIQAIEDCYEEVALPEARPAFAFSARRHARIDASSNARTAGGPSGNVSGLGSGSFALPSTSTELPAEEAPIHVDSWAVGPTRARRGNASREVVAPGNARRSVERGAPRPLALPAEDVGAVLAAIRSTNQRDRVLAALLSAAMTHARQAFCFRVRDGRLEGHDSAGSALGAAAVRRIVLPISTGSTFHRVLVEGQPHFGPLGLGATDQVLRIAIGSRGGRLSMHGLWIDARPAGILLADDVRTGQVGHDRLGAYAHAASQTLRRLIVDRG